MLFFELFFLMCIYRKGITEEMLRKVLGIGMEFFKLPLEEKAKLYSDHLANETGGRLAFRASPKANWSTKPNYCFTPLFRLHSPSPIPDCYFGFCAWVVSSYY